MSLPSAGYVTTVFDAPTGDVTATIIIDAENILGAVSEYVADINTSDPTRGRVAFDNSETECPFDHWAADPQTDLEEMRVNVGLVSSISTDDARTLRFYAPNTRNVAYGVSDTYGQYNAYSDDWLGYWPLSNDFNDRTSNQNHGTGNGGITAGDATGQIGKATSFDGVDDYVSTGSFGGYNAMTLMASVYSTEYNVDGGIMGVGSANTPYDRYTGIRKDQVEHVRASTGDVLTTQNTSDSPSYSFPIDEWTNIVSIHKPDYNPAIYINGSLSVAESVGNTVTPNTGILYLGAGVKGPIEAYCAQFAIFGVEISSQTVTYEYTQTSDNPGFFSGTVWNSAGYDPQPSLISGKLNIYSPTITNGQSISPAIISAKATLYTPTITVPGLNISLISGKAVIHAPIISNGQNISPTIISGTDAIYAPIIGQRISPDMIKCKLELYTPWTGRTAYTKTIYLTARAIRDINLYCPSG